MSDLHRSPDHDTSIQSGEVVAGFRTALQKEIFEYIRDHGPTSDGELEKLPQFKNYGASTVRKRRSELYQAGKVIDTGKRAGRFILWALPDASDDMDFG